MRRIAKKSAAIAAKKTGFLFRKFMRGNIKIPQANMPCGMAKNAEPGVRPCQKLPGLVGGVLVGLVVLDEAVDAECGDDAHGGDYDILDDFAHKKTPEAISSLKILFF